jgi:hypothetical protein
VDFSLAFPGLTREKMTKKPIVSVTQNITNTPFQLGYSIDRYLPINLTGSLPQPKFLSNKTNILLFNAQPLAACSWFLYDQIEQHNGLVIVEHPELFNDPFYAGTNSYESMLGVSGGINTTNTLSYCHNIIERIYQAYQEIEGINIDERMYLQFVFSLDFSRTSNIDVNYIDFMRDQDFYFDRYDTITCHEKSKDVALITKKNLLKHTQPQPQQGEFYYHKYLHLQYVFVVYKDHISDLDTKFKDKLRKINTILPEEFELSPNVQCQLPFTSGSELNYKSITVMLWWKNSSMSETV